MEVSICFNSKTVSFQDLGYFMAPPGTPPDRNVAMSTPSDGMDLLGLMHFPHRNKVRNQGPPKIPKSQADVYVVNRHGPTRLMGLVAKTLLREHVLLVGHRMDENPKTCTVLTWRCTVLGSREVTILMSAPCMEYIYIYVYVHMYIYIYMYV